MKKSVQLVLIAFTVLSLSSFLRAGIVIVSPMSISMTADAGAAVESEATLPIRSVVGLLTYISEAQSATTGEVEVAVAEDRPEIDSHRDVWLAIDSLPRIRGRAMVQTIVLRQGGISFDRADFAWIGGKGNRISASASEGLTSIGPILSPQFVNTDLNAMSLVE